METEKKISFLQIAGSLQRKKYPSCKLREACREKNILPANCGEFAEKKISFSQFAGSLQRKKYPSRNLREACREKFFLLKNDMLNKNQTVMKHILNALHWLLYRLRDTEHIILLTHAIGRRQFELRSNQPGQLHPMFFIRE